MMALYMPMQPSSKTPMMAFVRAGGRVAMRQPPSASSQSGTGGGGDSDRLQWGGQVGRSRVFRWRLSRAMSGSALRKKVVLEVFPPSQYLTPALGDGSVSVRAMPTRPGPCAPLQLARVRIGAAMADESV